MTTLRPRAAAGVGLRWGRAVVLSLTAWATASAAHVLGGGSLPTPPVVVALVLLTAWPLSLLLTRRAPTARVVGLLAAGQLVMHTALVLLSSWAAAPAAGSGAGFGSGMTSMPGMSSTTGMAGPRSAVLPAADPAAAMMSAHAMPLLPGPAMLLAHAVAAVLLGCGLAVAERAVFSLLDLLAWVGRPLRPSLSRIAGALAALTADLRRSGLAALGAIAVDTERTVTRLPRHLLVRAVVRRGPPPAPIAACGPALTA